MRAECQFIWPSGEGDLSDAAVYWSRGGDDY